MYFPRPILFVVSLVALLAASCSSEHGGGEEPSPGKTVGIAFGCSNDAWQEDPSTRAAGEQTGLETLFSSFRVWGYKTTASNDVQTVMDGYHVAYANASAGSSLTNTADWEYVGIKNPQLGTAQQIKYWDFSAADYRFFGYSPFDTEGVSTAATNGMVSAFSFPYSFSTAAKALTMPYVSNLWYARPPSGSVVSLTFAPLIAKVRFRFIYPDDTEEVTASDITFCDSRFADAPATATTPLRGTVTASYPIEGLPSGDQPQLSWTPSEGDGAVGQIMLTVPYEEAADRIHILTDPAQYEKWYYVPPLNIIPYEQGAYTLSLRINGKLKTAVVPAQFMQWAAGYQYTYIFKLTDDYSVITFADLQVEQWLPGSNIDNNGSGTEQW